MAASADRPRDLSSCRIPPGETEESAVRVVAALTVLKPASTRAAAAVRVVSSLYMDPDDGLRAIAKACLILSDADMVASMFPVEPDPDQMKEQISDQRSGAVDPESSSSTQPVVGTDGFVKVFEDVAYTTPKKTIGESASGTLKLAARRVALVVVYWVLLTVISDTLATSKSPDV